MNLIKVDRIDSKSSQAGFGFAANGSGLEIVRYVSQFIPNQAALGEDIRKGVALLDRAADDRLGMTQPVDSGGIDPIDAAVQACMDGRDRFHVVLGTPGKLPLSSTD